MAAGDVNTRTLGRMGNRLVMSGTLEAAKDAEGNGTAVALADTKSRIISCFVQNADDEEGARVVLNSNDGTADTANGSIYVVSDSTDLDTWNYEATLV
jgi:hypothetical protein